MRRVALAALVAASACTLSTPPRSPALVVGIRISPTNLDPGIGIDEASQRVGQLVFSSLLKIDDKLQVVPDLAVRFETTDSQTYVAEIPHGVRFHNGHEMTSADVAFTFRRYLDPAFVSSKKGAYRAIASIDVLDRYTVAFRLRQASAAFPINLAGAGIVPEGTGREAARAPVGSGPYRLTEFVPDDHVTLVPFPDYYAGAPKNAGVVLKVVPDETMRSLELRKGDVDLVVNDIAPDVVHELEQRDGLRVIQAPGIDWAYLGFNLRDPILRDPRVRQAIGYAIDTEAIVKYLRRGLARQTPGILPSVSWASAPDVFHFSYDPTRARQLLDAAGFADPDGDGPQPRLRLTLKTSTAEEPRLQASVIQQQLREIGIALDLRSYEFATLMADVVRGNVQIYSLQFVGVTDPDMLRRVFHSSQVPPEGFNRGYYANPAVDRLLDRAAVSLVPAERRDLYVEAQRLIADEAPVISLWAKTNVVVSQAGISGITLSPTADFRFLQFVSRQ
ncbi:MAG: ABC transporter substrate-binding protein [Vicinamibacterales bacterium]